MEFIFILIFSIAAIASLINRISKDNLNRKIKRALQNGDTDEFIHLSNLQREQQEKQHSANKQALKDQRYLDAMIVLDAAENGIFFPGGEEIFTNLDYEPQGEYRYTDDCDDWCYEDSYDDDQAEDDYISDHWGPV